MSLRELYLRQFGQLPQGIEKVSSLKQQVYFYNPDNLLGMHEVENAITMNENKEPVINPRVAIPSSWLVVDNETYYYSFTNVSDSDFEAIPGKSIKDL